jgi:hypothetical protein
VSDAPGADTASRLARALGPKYEVRGLLGRGGFAEVYEVFDRELERRLAVKVLRPDVAWTPGMLERFRHETKATARLNHPNILTIHFVGEGEGLVYYAMPFVEGRSLADLLRQEGPLPLERLVALARAVLDALEHAHRQGLLHRDIKPENIMIERATGKPLLVDFGIAKRLDAGKGVTQTGFVVGTPQYMSPEQALGDTKLDARSDLYSMGAVLFQMATGSPPFEGETSQEVVAKHLTEPPPAPRTLRQDVPQWLSDVIVKCLAKRPTDRFQSAAEVLDALTEGMADMAPLVSSRAMASAAPTVKIASGQRPAATQAVTRSGEAAGATETMPAPGAGATGAGTRRRAVLWWTLAGVVAAAVGGVALWTAMRPVLLFQNRLAEPVRLTFGAGERVVEAGGELALRLPWRRGLAMEWRLVRPAAPDGRALGVELGGTVALEKVRGRVRRAAEARGGEQAYFAPLITNRTGVPLAVTINAGLVGATPCGCTLPAGSTRAHIGYYPLFRNSTVRVEDARGWSATFTDLGVQVDPASGVVSLRFEPGDLKPPSGTGRR